MKQQFVFDGKSSCDYGVVIAGKTKSIAERDQTVVSVPGRCGDLILDNGRYKNVNVTYACGVKGINNFDALAAVLASTRGYKELLDTYDPDHFYLANFPGPIDPSVWKNKLGKFDLIFNCQPFRFRLDGKDMITLTASGSLHNAYHQSQPKLTIYGTGGTLQVGSQTIMLSTIDGYTVIDGGNAYKGMTNKNSTVSMPDQIFLDSGDNTITLGTGITSVEIVPRWCEL